MIIPGDPRSAGSFNHRQKYEVTGLRQDAEYECLVQARNRFGWSEASRIFHFFTGKRGAYVTRFKRAKCANLMRKKSQSAI